MIGVLAAIFAHIIVNLFSGFLYDQLKLDVAAGPRVILIVFLAYVLMRFLVERQKHLLFDRPDLPGLKPGEYHHDFGLKQYLLQLNVKNALPITAFAMALLLCRQYLPWTEGLLSLTTWLATTFPWIISWWGFRKVEFGHIRYSVKINDFIYRYRCVTEKWLREAFPFDNPGLVRYHMQLYVQRTFDRAERLDTSDTDNWVIRWGGRGREAGYVYHQPSQ